MPPKVKKAKVKKPRVAQKQKQKQTQIVTVNVTAPDKPKRKRRPAAKKATAAPAPQTGFPDFIRTVMPTASNIQTDKVLFQLADVTRQFETLQEKQKHATGNLMAADKLPPPPADEPPVIKSPPKSGRRSRSKDEKQEAEALGLEDKPKRTYVTRRTKAEEAAELLFQQGGMLRGSRHETSLAGSESGTMSSLTMTPGLMSPPQEEEEVMTIKVRKKGSKASLPSVSETPTTASLSSFTFGSASDETAPNF